jgi:hypothetical protein
VSDIVQKLWGFCHTLRHDGIDYGDYIEQITYLLFLKMADERLFGGGSTRSQPPGFQSGLTWVDRQPTWVAAVRQRYGSVHGKPHFLQTALSGQSRCAAGQRRWPRRKAAFGRGTGASQAAGQLCPGYSAPVPPARC